MATLATDPVIKTETILCPDGKKGQIFLQSFRSGRYLYFCTQERIKYCMPIDHCRKCCLFAWGKHEPRGKEV